MIRLKRKLYLSTLSSFFILIYCSYFYYLKEKAEEKDKIYRLLKEYCYCPKRPARRQNTDSEIPYNATTCGMGAYAKGRGQKVIGFTFFSREKMSKEAIQRYYDGVADNLKLLHHFYPGWIMRLYFDMYEEDPSMGQQFCDLSCDDFSLDLCDIRSLPGTPMIDAKEVFPRNWRFFAALDPQVDILISRDLDSRFSEREVSAVDEWVKSKEAFHVMRDHELHENEMLAGMWGVKLTQKDVRLKWKEAWSSAQKDNLVLADRNEYDFDQQFLKKYIWSWSKDITLAHDSYHCGNFTQSRPFPTKRKDEPNNFVGAYYFLNVTYLKECPEECRPTDHRDWLYC